MGSQPEDHDEITVLVTGFGPFRDQYPVNPSYEIARSLPSYLPPLRAKDPSTRQTTSSLPIPEVRILTHPEPIRVSYSYVRSLVPSFWDGRKRPDVVIHIGMAGPRPLYQIERRGHRQGYRSRDVDGETLVDEEEGGHGEGWVWRGCPEELETELDLDGVVERWRGHSSKDMDLRISEDPGRYLCDFIYYSSLAHLWKQGRDRKAVFLHVPADASEEAVSRGRELTVNLIRSIVESEVAKRTEKVTKPVETKGV